MRLVAHPWHASLALVPSSVAVAILVACSSSPSGAGAAPGPYDAGSGSCPFSTPAVVAAACASCLDAQCTVQLDAYASQDGCGDYLACACPGGVVASASAVNACQTKTFADGCARAITNVEVCQDTLCSGVCSGSKGGGLVDGGDAGGSSGGGAFLDASLSAACRSYATCCEVARQDGGPSAATQNDCEEAASLLTDAQCEAYVVAYQDAGVACSP